MISYNDTINISSLYDSKSYDELLSFINSKLKCTNIIQFLQKILNTKFSEPNTSIKLTTKTNELIIYKENFLTGLPAYSESTHTIDDYNITISYPSCQFISNASYIKKIQKDDNIIEIDKNNYKVIPINIIQRCKPFISEYKNKLNNAYVFYLNKENNSRFMYETGIINYIIYLCFVYDYDNLLLNQLAGMKNFNFMYQDFDNITFDKFKKYIKLMNKLTNE